MSKRGHGEGTIAERGENSWRLRYRIGGQPFSKTFHGSAGEARKELRRLLKSGDDGVHVAPARTTLAAWVEEWLALRQRKVRRRVKEPKTERGKRIIKINARLLELLRAEHARHLAIRAGVPEGADVDLALVKLPADALVFPSPASPFDFTRFRNVTSVSKEFAARAKSLGFRIRLHDLRHSHGSILLAEGMPIHEVAARLGHTAAVLLTVYAHCLQKNAERAAEIVEGMTNGAL